MKLFRSFKFRLLFVSGVMIAVACSVLALISMRDITRLQIKAFADKAVPVAEETASVVDADTFLALFRSEDSTDSEYVRMCAEFARRKATLTCRFLYAMAPAGGTNFKYIYDGADPSDPDEFSPLGTVEDISSYGSAPFDAIAQKRTTISDPEFQEEWGWTISAYAPVLDRSGNAVGFVGCDYPAEDLMRTLRAEKVKTTAICLAFILLCVAAELAVAIPFFRSLDAVSKNLRQLASDEGDLSVSIPAKSRDEVGDLVENCNSVILKLAGMVREVKGHVALLSESGKAVIQSTGETEKAVEETVTSIEAVNEKTRAQNDLMRSVSDGIAVIADEIRSMGGMQSDHAAAVRQSSASIEEMTSNFQAMGESLSLIDSRYTDLMKITREGRGIQNKVVEQAKKVAEHSKGLAVANTTIEEIAVSTNLLAMNAAIEAAHAGETGKGFAVVAGEIRALAENSAKQSDSIKKLLASITGVVDEIVKSTGLSLESFGNIESQINEIGGMIRQIHGGMEEQTVGIRELLDSERVITQAAESINGISKKVEESSGVSFGGVEKLREYSDEISGTMQVILTHVERMRGLSESACAKMTENMNISDAVAGLMNSFKV